MEFKTPVKIIIDQKNYGTILVDWMIVTEMNDNGATKIYPKIKALIDFPEKNPHIKVKIKPSHYNDAIALYLENTAQFDSKSRTLFLVFLTKPK